MGVVCCFGCVMRLWHGCAVCETPRPACSICGKWFSAHAPPLSCPLSVQPPLEDATAARNQAVTALLGGLAAGGLTAQEPAALRSSVQQAVEEARRLPDMPPFVDYTALLADLQQWVEALQAATAGVRTARQAAAAATEDASNQLEAADQSDAPATYRLLWLRWGWAKGAWLCQRAMEGTAEFGAAAWLIRPHSATAKKQICPACFVRRSLVCCSEQLPLVEKRLAAVGEQVAPAAAASDALQQLRQRIEEECVPALVKPPLAELEAERDGALSTAAAELSGRGLAAVVRHAAQHARRGLTGWLAGRVARLIESAQTALQ